MMVFKKIRGNTLGLLFLEYSWEHPLDAYELNEFAKKTWTDDVLELKA